MTRFWVAGPGVPDFDGDVFTDRAWGSLLQQAEQGMGVEAYPDITQPAVTVGTFHQIRSLDLPYAYWLGPSFSLLDFSIIHGEDGTPKGLLIDELMLHGWTLSHGEPQPGVQPVIDLAFIRRLVSEQPGDAP